MSITEYLETQGIKHSHLGFTYLSDAIKIAHIEGIDFKLSYVHKAVADSRKSTPARVERNMRHAIRAAGHKENLKEFIATAVFRLEEEAQ